VSPLRPSFSPQPEVFSRSFRFCSQPPRVRHAVSYSCELFVVAKKVNSFVIKQIQTLCAEHPGWGYLGYLCFPAVHGSPASVRGSRFCPSFAFINLRIAPSHPSNCNILYFMHLRIAFFATPLNSHRCKLPGCHPSTTFPPRSSISLSRSFPLLQSRAIVLTFRGIFLNVSE
jgi:hypothetical protein